MQTTSRPQPSDAAKRRTGLRIIVVIAIVGLVVLSMASLGGLSLPVPTANPHF